MKNLVSLSLVSFVIVWQGFQVQAADVLDHEQGRTDSVHQYDVVDIRFFAERLPETPIDAHFTAVFSRDSRQSFNNKDLLLYYVPKECDYFGLRLPKDSGDTMTVTWFDPLTGEYDEPTQQKIPKWPALKTPDRDGFHLLVVELHR